MKITADVYIAPDTVADTLRGMDLVGEMTSALERACGGSVGALVSCDCFHGIRTVFGKRGFVVFIRKEAWQVLNNASPDPSGQPSFLLSIPRWLLPVDEAVPRNEPPWRLAENEVAPRRDPVCGVVLHELWAAERGDVFFHVDMGGWRGEDQPSSSARLVILTNFVARQFLPPYRGPDEGPNYTYVRYAVTMPPQHIMESLPIQGSTLLFQASTVLFQPMRLADVMRYYDQATAPAPDTDINPLSRFAMDFIQWANTEVSEAVESAARRLPPPRLIRQAIPERDLTPDRPTRSRPLGIEPPHPMPDRDRADAPRRTRRTATQVWTDLTQRDGSEPPNLSPRLLERMMCMSHRGYMAEIGAAYQNHRPRPRARRTQIQVLADLARVYGTETVGVSTGELDRMTRETERVYMDHLHREMATHCRADRRRTPDDVQCDLSSVQVPRQILERMAALSDEEYPAALDRWHAERERTLARVTMPRTEWQVHADLERIFGTHTQFPPAYIGYLTTQSHRQYGLSLDRLAGESQAGDPPADPLADPPAEPPGISRLPLGYIFRPYEAQYIHPYVILADEPTMGIEQQVDGLSLGDTPAPPEEDNPQPTPAEDGVFSHYCQLCLCVHRNGQCPRRQANVYTTPLRPDAPAPDPPLQ